MNEPPEPQRMRTAITGGVAMGKTVVLQILSELGFSVTSADEIAREVFDDENIQAKIAEVLSLPFPLNRGQVREAIASSSNSRRALNGIMHPEILQKMRYTNATFFEVPLLIESCLQFEFDLVWVVTCPVEVQETRLSERVGSLEDARRIIATQLPNAIKEVFADSVIRTNQPISHVRDDIEKLIRAS